MRWPWVSRAKHEAVVTNLHTLDMARRQSEAMCSQLDYEHRYLRTMIDELRDEKAALLEKYHALKLAGANEPAVIPPPPPHALAKYPKTRAALDAMGHGQGGSVRRAMTAEAIKMLTVEGLSDEFVAKAVAQGEPYQSRTDDGN